MPLWALIMFVVSALVGAGALSCLADSMDKLAREIREFRINGVKVERGPR